MWDERLNTAIDEVARQATDGPPEGGDDFRRRVLARIASGAAPRRAWPAAFVLSPLAAAAVVVLAIVVSRSGAVRPTPDAPSQASATSQPDATQRPSAASQPDTAPRADATSAARLSPSPLHGLGGTGRPAARPAPGAPRNAQRAPSEIDALAPPPLGVAPIDVSSIDVAALPPTDSIGVQGLDTVASIAVAPIDADRPRY